MKKDAIPGDEREGVQVNQRWLEEERMAHKRDASDEGCPNTQADDEGTVARNEGTLYRTVDSKGYLVVSGKKFYIGFFFAGKCIAIRRLDGTGIELIFRNKRLARIDVLSGLLEFH